MAAVSSPVNSKLLFKNFIAIAVLLLAGVFALKGLHANNLHRKSSLSLSSGRAEILLRLAETFELLPKSKFNSQSDKKAIDTKDYAIVNANQLLDEAAAEQPSNIVILCKKIILEAQLGKSLKSDIQKLTFLSAASNEKNFSTQEKKLANLILSLYAKKQDQSEEIYSDAENILQTNLSEGWFAENALLEVYKSRHHYQDYKALLTDIQNKNRWYLYKLVLFALIGVVSLLIGVVVILYQLIIGREKPIANIVQEENNSSARSQGIARYGWQTVILVFLSWFLTQVFVAYIANMLKERGFLISYASSLSSAISILAIYLFGNGSVFLYIYFFVFRANNLDLSNGLNLRFKTNNYGTIALFVVGILGWFAAVPVVLAASIIAMHFLDSNGSSNPIISIIMQAAQDNNFLAILLFYFVLGVLAPFCEETLFRGFLYNFLRSRHGIIFANVLSSALFSVFHFDPGAALTLFCLGSVFAYIREKTDSIVPAMVAHGMWNSGMFTFVLVLLDN